MANPTTEKSQSANVLLTFFLGPFGLLYAHPRAAIALIISGPVLWFVIAGSSGMNDFEALLFGITIYGFLELISIVWGVITVNNHNKEVLSRRERLEHNRHVEQLEAIEKSSKQVDEEAKKVDQDLESEGPQATFPDHQEKGREDLEEALDSSMVVIQAAALTMYSSFVWPTFDSSQSEKVRMNWESHLRKILDRYPRHLRPSENALQETIQQAWDFAENHHMR